MLSFLAPNAPSFLQVGSAKCFVGVHALDSLSNQGHRQDYAGERGGSWLDSHFSKFLPSSSHSSMTSSTYSMTSRDSRRQRAGSHSSTAAATIKVLHNFASALLNSSIVWSHTVGCPQTGRLVYRLGRPVYQRGDRCPHDLPLKRVFGRTGVQYAVDCKRRR